MTQVEGLKHVKRVVHLLTMDAAALRFADTCMHTVSSLLEIVSVLLV